MEQQGCAALPDVDNLVIYMSGSKPKHACSRSSRKFVKTQIAGPYPGGSHSGSLSRAREFHF